VESSNVVVSAGEALDRIEAALDAVDPNRTSVPPERQLAWVSKARRLRTRLDALAGLLTAEAERSQASEKAAGTPLANWLGATEVVSRKEATREVFQARALADHRGVGLAASRGRINSGQARVIGRVLDDIAPRLDATQKGQAEQLMVELAGRLDADQLAKAAPQVLRQVVPDAAEESLEARLQRQAEAAHRNRSLRFFHSEGSIHFEGSLPQVEGERFISLINSHREKLRRSAIEARDPMMEHSTAEQRRADALVAFLTEVGAAKPEAGRGTARVLVTLSYDNLRTQAAGAGLIGAGDPLSAGDLRRLCCEAELIPVVLGTSSEPLDVGMAHRLATRPLRDALTIRDRGCAFPGCDERPELCEAHHITPWWDGGASALSNLVLLCHRHHAEVEPHKHGIRDQWVVHIDAGSGQPIFTPPKRMQALCGALTAAQPSGSLPSDTAQGRGTPLDGSPPGRPAHRQPAEHSGDSVRANRRSQPRREPTAENADGLARTEPLFSATG
jgi:Domain of unknown function (DUF222)/HNH endonuclease